MSIPKTFVCLLLLSQVQCLMPGSYEVGVTVSAVSLALAIPHYFVFNTHLRILDFVQLIFLFSLINPLYSTFINYLSVSWLQFIPNFYSSFCDANGFMCNVGYALCFGTVLIGIIVLALLITGIEKCRKPHIRFMPVFTLFKGLVRWIYISLSSVSALFLFKYLTGGVTGQLTNFIAPIVVLAVCFIFPIVQLIAGKVAETPETEDTKSKWVEFLALYRLMFVGVLVQLQALNLINLLYIGTFIVLTGYAIGYMLLNKFTNIPERVLVGVHEAVLVTLFALLTFKPDIIVSMDIDFYAVSAIFLLELIYELYKWIEFCKQTKLNAEVTPLPGARHSVPINSFASDNSLDDI